MISTNDRYKYRKNLTKPPLSHLPKANKMAWTWKRVTFEQFWLLFERRETKTERFTTANRKKRKQKWANENTKQIHATGTKRGKTRTTKWRLVLVLYLINWEGGAKFYNQTQSKAKSIPNPIQITLDTQLKLLHLSGHTFMGRRGTNRKLVLLC